jgi:hypothetical protein
VFSILVAASCRAEPIAVRFLQGSAHGFVILRNSDNSVAATGEVTQTAHGDRVSSRTVFHFRDGSVDEEQTIFTQRSFFRLVSDRHVQHGPSFPKPLDMIINAVTGEVTFRGTDGRMDRVHYDLPPDLSNGLPPNLLLNISPATPETRVSYLAPGAKPRLVQLVIKPGGPLPFAVGGLHRIAIDFVVHVDLGGIAGVVAPVIGKQPADYHIWIQGGLPPAFIREEGALYEGGPTYRIEQVSPSFR